MPSRTSFGGWSVYVFGHLLQVNVRLCVRKCQPRQPHTAVTLVLVTLSDRLCQVSCGARKPQLFADIQRLVLAGSALVLPGLAVLQAQQLRRQHGLYSHASSDQQQEGMGYKLRPEDEADQTAW